MVQRMVDIRSPPKSCGAIADSASAFRNEYCRFPPSAREIAEKSLIRLSQLRGGSAASLRLRGPVSGDLGYRRDPGGRVAARLQKRCCGNGNALNQTHGS